MSSLYRLVYASKAKVDLGESGINLEIGRILTKSKRNNPKVNIGGVLYYANSHFFQVLEGDRSAVRSLYQKIIQDERHSDAQVLLEGAINQREFNDWSMHFIPAGSDIQLLLKDHGHKAFTPFEFSSALVEEFLTVLKDSGVYQRKPFSMKGLLSGWAKLAKAR